MKKWKAHVQINGEDYSSFDCFEFDISDDLYDEAIALVNAGMSIYGTDTAEKLENLAEKAFDFESMCPVFDEDEPEQEKYDSEEEYQEAINKYENAKKDFFDGFFVDSFSIDDPGEFLRFKKKVLGLKTDFVEGTHEWKGEYEAPDWFIVKYKFSYTVDFNGFITDVDDVNAETCVSDDVKCSYWDTTEPDYDEIFKQVMKTLKDSDFD